MKFSKAFLKVSEPTQHIKKIFRIHYKTFWHTKNQRHLTSFQEECWSTEANPEIMQMWNYQCISLLGLLQQPVLLKQLKFIIFLSVLEATSPRSSCCQGRCLGLSSWLLTVFWHGLSSVCRVTEIADISFCYLDSSSIRFGPLPYYLI